MVEYLGVDKAEDRDGADSANADAGSDDMGRRSNEGEFNFDRELLEYNDLVKDIKLTNVQEGNRADLEVVTLEGTYFKMDWVVTGGMKIVAIRQDGGELDENPEDKKAYDDLN